jgi:hypothetical protein
MDWTYPHGAGPEGLFEIGRRLSAHLGRIPDATTFTNDAREMLRITRRVETVARGGHLLVGFQNAAKLDAEHERYLGLVAAGTRIVAFGSGRPATDVDGLEYRELPADRFALGNQWFLISDAPERVGFVSWEISQPEVFGKGGATTAGKRFVGFITDDPIVVAELATVLNATTGIALPPVETPPKPDVRTRALLDTIAAISPDSTAAEPGAVVLPLRPGDSDRAMRLAIAIARDERRPLVVVDRSAESIFGTPYDDLRGDDDFRPRPDRLFSAGIARREGRSAAARAISAATALGIEAGGWFPTSAGAKGISEAVRRFEGGLVVVPESTRRPSVGERIRGMTVESLDKLGVPVIVAD